VLVDISGRSQGEIGIGAFLPYQRPVKNIDLLAGVRCPRRASRQPRSPACRSSPRMCSCSCLSRRPPSPPNAYRAAAVSSCILWCLIW